MRFARSMCCSLAGVTLMTASFTPATAQGSGGATSLDFSGVMYANFAYRTDSAARAASGGEAASRFDIERVYLNFRLPAGDRASVRFTADVFQGDQSGSSYYRGWTARFKYAYLQLKLSDNLLGVNGLGVTTRLGIIQNAEIEHEDGFWERYVSPVPIDRHSYFSSADVGAALIVALPQRFGEVHGVVSNGTGYSAAERDRFKDYTLRVSLTPFSQSDAAGGWLKTAALTGWVYAGQTASRFVTGGTGQAGPVSDGLRRERAGVLVGVRDRRLTAALSYARRTETTEGGDNTPTAPRTVTDVSGSVASASAIVRPGAWRGPDARASWGFIVRVDELTADIDGPASDLYTTAAAFWEPNARVTFALDHETTRRRGGSTTPEARTLFVRLQVVF